MAFISSDYFDEGFQVVDLSDDVELELSAFCEILPLSRYENKECLNGREFKTSKDVSESPSEAFVKGRSESLSKRSASGSTIPRMDA